MSFYTAVWVFSATVKELKNVGDWKIVEPDRNYLVRNWYINDTSLWFNSMALVGVMSINTN